MERNEFINHLIKIGYWLKLITDFNEMVLCSITNDCQTEVFIDLNNDAIGVFRDIINNEGECVIHVTKFYGNMKSLRIEGKALYNTENYTSIGL